MSDPMNALRALQIALENGNVDPMPCEVYPEVRFVFDQPLGKPRFTYAKIVDGKVLAISLFALVEPIRGVPCFQLGYAVAESMRQQGLSSEIVAKGLDELRNGLQGQGPARFYVEAVVSVANLPSNKLARRLLSDAPTACTDAYSGETSMQYLRLME